MYNINDSTIYKKPNFLIIMVDEQRFPSIYETEDIKNWRSNYLKAQNYLLKNGVEFTNHYAASTACAPSRASLYTGQYPSLHGVTQTDGGGATAFSPNIFWLDSNTVPTFGDYLRIEGYETFWKGKWHASHSDITIPGTHDSFLSYCPNTGIPIKENEDIYLNSNRLNEFGFNEWIGPEPHGSSPQNSGSSSAIGLSGRDEVYTEHIINLIKKLESSDTKKPWAMVASFINPHDIALFGAYTRLLPSFNFHIDESVPYIPTSPTSDENFSTKPKVQENYKEIYPKLIQPLSDSETYRKLYYSLQLKVDKEVYKVLNTLENSCFYNNTIVIYTSDHGDMLGSHGGLFQKWYVAYEEAIHVPLIISSPLLNTTKKSVDILTSHVDILPTILDLAGINKNKALMKLKNTHIEAQDLVGKSLANFLVNKHPIEFTNEPIYFMTDDDPSKTFSSSSPLGKPLEPVNQPSHIETIVVKLPTGKNSELETWKYSRYFDNPQFWSDPNVDDVQNIIKCTEEEYSICHKKTKNNPNTDDYEMYNLTLDPLETKNLMNPKYQNLDSKIAQIILNQILISESKKKRIYPKSNNPSNCFDYKSTKPPFLNL